LQTEDKRAEYTIYFASQATAGIWMKELSAVAAEIKVKRKEHHGIHISYTFTHK